MQSFPRAGVLPETSILLTDDPCADNVGFFGCVVGALKELTSPLWGREGLYLILANPFPLSVKAVLMGNSALHRGITLPNLVMHWLVTPPTPMSHGGDVGGQTAIFTTEPSARGGERAKNPQRAPFWAPRCQCETYTKH